MNIPFNDKEGDFKDFKGSEVDEGDEISGHRYWQDMVEQ